MNRNLDINITRFGLTYFGLWALALLCNAITIQLFNHYLGDFNQVFAVGAAVVVALSKSPKK